MNLSNAALVSTMEASTELEKEVEMLLNAGGASEAGLAKKEMEELKSKVPGCGPRPGGRRDLRYILTLPLTLLLDHASPGIPCVHFTWIEFLETAEVSACLFSGAHNQASPCDKLDEYADVKGQTPPNLSTAENSRTGVHGGRGARAASGAIQDASPHVLPGTEAAPHEQDQIKGTMRSSQTASRKAIVYGMDI